MKQKSTATEYYDDLDPSGSVTAIVQLNPSEAHEYKLASALSRYEFLDSDIVTNIFLTSGNPHPYYAGPGRMFVDQPSFSYLKRGNQVEVWSRFGRDC